MYLDNRQNRKWNPIVQSWDTKVLVFRVSKTRGTNKTLRDPASVLELFLLVTWYCLFQWSSLSSLADRRIIATSHLLWCLILAYLSDISMGIFSCQIIFNQAKIMFLLFPILAIFYINLANMSKIKIFLCQLPGPNYPSPTELVPQVQLSPPSLPWWWHLTSSVKWLEDVYYIGKTIYFSLASLSEMAEPFISKLYFNHEENKWHGIFGPTFPKL